MRKGRSSRRSRVSRPLIGAKAPASSADALSTEVGPSEPPRIVVGVPPSDPPPGHDGSSESPGALEAEGVRSIELPPSLTSSLDPLETSETPKVEAAKAADDAPEEKTETFASFASTTIGTGTPTPPAEPAVESEDKTEKDEGEKTRMFASTLAFGSSLAAPEPEANTKRSFASTLAFGSKLDADTKAQLDPTSPVPVKEAPLLAKPVEPTVETTLGTKAEAKSDKSDNKKNKNKKKNAALEVSTTTDPDEISVPPIGDVAESFFSEGDVSRHLTPEPLVDDALTVVDKAKRKSEPHVVERRARLARYVKFAVAGAAVLCLAAVGQTTMSSSKVAPSTMHMTAVAAPATESPAAKAAEPAAAPVATTQPAVTPEPAAQPSPATPQPVVSAAVVEPAAAPPPAEEITGDPKEEKAKARSLLEKRKIAEAIEAGERSVKLDPTDGEAWLILGAAYQEKGNLVDARRAYGACVKEAKTGPRHECAKMLR